MVGGNGEVNMAVLAAVASMVVETVMIMVMVVIG